MGSVENLSRNIIPIPKIEIIILQVKLNLVSTSSKVISGKKSNPGIASDKLWL